MKLVGCAFDQWTRAKSTLAVRESAQATPLGSQGGAAEAEQDGWEQHLPGFGTPGSVGCRDGGVVRCSGRMLRDFWDKVTDDVRCLVFGPQRSKSERSSTRFQPRRQTACAGHDADKQPRSNDQQHTVAAAVGRHMNVEKRDRKRRETECLRRLLETRAARDSLWERNSPALLNGIQARRAVSYGPLAPAVEQTFDVVILVEGETGIVADTPFCLWQAAAPSDTCCEKLSESSVDRGTQTRNILIETWVGAVMYVVRDAERGRANSG